MGKQFPSFSFAQGWRKGLNSGWDVQAEQAGGAEDADGGGGGSDELLWCVQHDQRRELGLQSTLGACLLFVLAASQSFKSVCLMI